MLVNNLILSQLDYCNAILANATKNDLKPLQKILYNSVRFSYNLNWNEHVTSYLIKLHFLPIKYRVLFKLSIIGYKIVNNIAPIYLLKSFNLYYPTTTQNLRIGCGRDMLMLVYKKSVHNQFNKTLSKLTQVWNSLPYEICCISVILCVKKSKTYYFREAYIVNDESVN